MKRFIPLLALAALPALAQPVDALQKYQEYREADQRRELLYHCSSACGNNGNCRAKCLQANARPPAPQQRPAQPRVTQCFTDRYGYTICQ